MFNYLLGSLSRIFTTLQEVDDKLILYSFVAAFSLNAILALQMVYYWNSPGLARAEKKPQKTVVEKTPAAAAPALAAATAESSSVAPRPTGKTPTTRRRG